MLPNTPVTTAALCLSILSGSAALGNIDISLVFDAGNEFDPGDQFVIENTSTTPAFITRVRLDFGTSDGGAVLDPDDPLAVNVAFGTGVTGAFEVDSDAVNFSPLYFSDDIPANGRQAYRSVEIGFTDFNAIKFFGFQTDMDSSQGFLDEVTGADVENASAFISLSNGLELVAVFEETGPSAATASVAVLAGDTDVDNDVDDIDFGTAIASYTGPVGNVGRDFFDADTDSDGDVDDIDLGTMIANYTGPLSPASVPEPNTLLCAAAASALALRRRPYRVARNP